MHHFYVHITVTSEPVAQHEPNVMIDKSQIHCVPV